jgi:phage terminase large subunit
VIEQTIDLGYTRRRIFAAFHDRSQRWACMICHRRAGKTVASLMDILDRALGIQDSRFAYIAPFRHQAGGGRITLFGADNIDALRGPAFDGVVLDEYADISPSLFPQVVRPALADRGGCAVLTGTVKGRNQLWRTYQDAVSDPSWYTALLKASETGVLSKEELDDAHRMMTPEQYAAEFECDPYAGILGAYYGKEITACEIEGRIVPALARLPGPVL